MEKVYEVIERIPEKFRYLLVLAVSVVVIALYVFLVRFPAQDELAALGREYNNVHKTYTEKKAIADDLQNWQLEVQRLQVQLEEALNQLPEEVDTEQLLISIPNIAKKNALVATKFEIESERRQSSYAEVPMVLELEGTYQGIGSFAQEIGDQPRIMAVQKLEMTRGKTAGADKGKAPEPGAKEEGVMLSIEAEVVTYRFLADGGGGASAKGPRRGRGR